MIIPTLLTHTKEEFITRLKLIEGYVATAHIDVMNDTFVQGTTFWHPRELETIATSLDYELHLMTDHPVDIIRKFGSRPNISRVYIHIEANGDINDAIKEARYHGYDIGIAINPETSTQNIEPFLSRIDAVQFMGVTPGASGRELHENVFKKITDFHATYANIEIAVDGSVNHDTIGKFKAAGATRFAAGSEIFEAHENPQTAIKELEALIC